MSLGTISYKDEIYNLDYITSKELEKLLDAVEKEKAKVKREIKKEIN